MHLSRIVRGTLLGAAFVPLAGIAPGLLPGATLAAQSASDAQQTARTDVPVRTVMLFSSGVGYFEHAGSVRGNRSAELRFRTSQINDILKSLVLQDFDGGRVSTVTYPSQDPLDKTLRSFQVDITGNPSLGDLLNQLRGARITAQASGERIAGTILGVESRRKELAQGSATEIPVLNVLTGGFIRAIELPSVTGLSLDDPQLQEELGLALAALNQARDQDQKPVVINFTGNGERRVRIGYVVETPVWKTSYRLLLGDAGASLQGWAIVENQTDSDWDNVSLSLVSGRPISFVMDLYQPLYMTRPTVVPELLAGLRPQLYDAAIAGDREKVAMPAGRGAGIGSGVGSGGGRGGAVPQAARAPIVEQGVMGSTTTITDYAVARETVQSIASAARMGELFQYTVPNVTLARQKSAMLPIVTDSVVAERVSIFNAAVLPANPLNGVRLRNVTGKHLLQGPITVLEKNGYAGDARIDNIPPGQDRLLSYGVDLEMRVDNTKNSSTSAVVTGRIAGGLLTIERKFVATQEYVADNRGDKDKQLIVEHPIRQGWKLVAPATPLEATATLYRFQGNAAAKKATVLVVKEESVRSETVALFNADEQALLMYSRTGEIPAAVRAALVRAAELRRVANETERQIGARTQQVTEITEEQQRIRENMRTVSQNTPYYQRLLAKLNEQESSIERLQTERDALQARHGEQLRALREFVEGVTISS